MLRTILTAGAATLTLAACATAPAPESGFMSGYQGLEKPGRSLRAAVRGRADPEALALIRRVALEPTVLAPGAEGAWLTEGERTLLLRELDAQLCFEMTERFELAPADEADARLRAAIVRVRPTGRVASMASAAAGFFIPGPLGVRAPGTLGGLAMEAELVDGASGAQLGAMTWARQATAVGTDDPSLSRVGDALQFAEPFGDAAAAAFTPAGSKPLRIDPKADPCAQYGPRFRPEGLVAGFATGLYVPELSGARKAPLPTPAP